LFAATAAPETESICGRSIGSFGDFDLDIAKTRSAKRSIDTAATAHRDPERVTGLGLFQANA
jgi:hypothetical protein